MLRRRESEADQRRASGEIPYSECIGLDEKNLRELATFPESFVMTLWCDHAAKGNTVTTILAGNQRRPHQSTKSTRGAIGMMPRSCPRSSNLRIALRPSGP